MKKDDSLDRMDHFWLAELMQAREDWRHLDSILWQMPVISVTLSAALLGIAFYAVEDRAIQAAISGMATLLVAVFAFSMHRYRRLQINREDMCDQAVRRFVELRRPPARRLLTAFLFVQVAMVILALLLAMVTASILLGVTE